MCSVMENQRLALENQHTCTHKQTNKHPNKQAHQQTNYKEADTEANKHTTKQRMEDIRKDCEQVSNQERRTHQTGKYTNRK